MSMRELFQFLLSSLIIIRANAVLEDRFDTDERFHRVLRTIRNAPRPVTKRPITKKKESPLPIVRPQNYSGTPCARGLKSHHIRSSKNASDVINAFRDVDRTDNRFAVCVLMVDEDTSMLHWLAKAAQHNVTAYIMTDNENGTTNGFKRINEGVTVLYINPCDSRLSGYHEASFWNKKGVHSWDKALFFFARLCPKSYGFMWLLENDVFVPSLDSFYSVHAAAVSDNHDLVIPRHDREEMLLSRSVKGKPKTWAHWSKVSMTFKAPHPWFHSLACVTGLSSRLLREIDSYVRDNNRLEFIEVIFNTLAAHRNYSIWTPSALKTIIFRAHGIPEAEFCDIVLAAPTNWFHPAKDQKRLIGACILSGKFPSWPLVPHLQIPGNITEEALHS